MRAESLPQDLDLCVDSGFQAAFPYESIFIEISLRPVGFRFYQHAVNIVAQLAGRKFVATGEANSLDLALIKAHSELVERSALIASPIAASATTSNGWAAHPSEDQAKLNAVFELVERDAVLAQWYSRTPFLRLIDGNAPAGLKKWITTELALSEYPELIVLLSTTGLGPSVTCILKNTKGLGVSGHATRATLPDSINAALAEACRAAHASIRREYWGDTLKLKRSDAGWVDPGAHSVFYAYHMPFLTWMTGEELSWDEANVRWATGIKELMQNIDGFQFETVLKTPLFTGFAKHPLAFDLSWGTTTDEVVKSAGAKRMGLNFINKETHVVS
jgi:hypothetical protein